MGNGMEWEIGARYHRAGRIQGGLEEHVVITWFWISVRYNLCFILM